MDKELIRNIIVENQQLVQSVELVERPFEFEDNGNYVFVGVRQAGKSYMLYQRAKQLLKAGYDIDQNYNKNIEVDFFVPDEKIGVQVSYSIDDSETRERELKALASLNKFIPLNRALVITKNTEEIVEYQGLKIEIIPIWKWILL